jgi:PadR family transcriptional regulator AphA
VVAPIELSLAEWVVLALIDERPSHGFAIAALTGAEGSLGNVWQIPRPVVYRSLPRLADGALIEVATVEPGRGPRRMVYAVTPEGQRAVAAWLTTPVRHVRDIRSHLLVKLALLDRREAASSVLLARQRDVLIPIVAALGEQHGRAEGFEAVLLAWRRTSVQAALAFVDAVTSPVSA